MSVSVDLLKQESLPPLRRYITVWLRPSFSIRLFRLVMSNICRCTSTYGTDAAHRQPHMLTSAPNSLFCATYTDQGPLKHASEPRRSRCRSEELHVKPGHALVGCMLVRKCVVIVHIHNVPASRRYTKELESSMPHIVSRLQVPQCMPDIHDFISNLHTFELLKLQAVVLSYPNSII
jgi:hypothetical protein